jgi:hypothetical protein
MLKMHFFQGEALGALGAFEAEHDLKKFAADPNPDVSETCQIALGRLQWLRDHGSSSADLAVSFIMYHPVDKYSIVEFRSYRNPRTIPLTPLQSPLKKVPSNSLMNC